MGTERALAPGDMLGRFRIALLVVAAGTLACGSSGSSPSASDAGTDASSDAAASVDASTGDVDASDSAADAGRPVEGAAEDAPTDSSPVVDAGEGSEAGDAGASSSCPASPPPYGEACSPSGLECEYGDAVQLLCNTVATCTATGWQVMAGVQAACTPPSADGGTCPATFAQVPADQPCVPFLLTCAYPNGICYCTIDHTGSPLIWTCFPTTGCPYPRPRLGAPCTTEMLQCDYSTCGASVRCTGGLWQQGNGGCHG
jgi:hypothetical protein